MLLLLLLLMMVMILVVRLVVLVLLPVLVVVRLRLHDRAAPPRKKMALNMTTAMIMTAQCTTGGYHSVAGLVLTSGEVVVSGKSVVVEPSTDTAELRLKHLERW